MVVLDQVEQEINLPLVHLKVKMVEQDMKVEHMVQVVEVVLELLEQTQEVIMVALAVLVLQTI